MNRFLPSVLFSALAATGCGMPAYGTYNPYRGYRVVGGGDVLENTSTGFLVDAPRSQVVYVVAYNQPPSPPLPPQPPAPPRVTPRDPTHLPFDQTAALEALHAVDLGECSERGAPQTYAHARVTFDESGHATKVVIDAPSGLSTDAVQCLGDRIGRASARPFEGAPVTVGAGFYVR